MGGDAISYRPPGKDGHRVLSAAENGRRTRSSSNLSGRVGSVEEDELPMADKELGPRNS